MGGSKPLLEPVVFLKPFSSVIRSVSCSSHSLCNLHCLYLSIRCAQARSGHRNSGRRRRSASRGGIGGAGGEATEARRTKRLRKRDPRRRCRPGYDGKGFAGVVDCQPLPCTTSPCSLRCRLCRPRRRPQVCPGRDPSATTRSPHSGPYFVCRVRPFYELYFLFLRYFCRHCFSVVVIVYVCLSSICGFVCLYPHSEFVPLKPGQSIQQLDLWLDVDGVRKQTGSTASMIFPVLRLMEYVSSIMTLEDGDVILTGTPAGTRLPYV